jgi:hypothetical protein
MSGLASEPGITNATDTATQKSAVLREIANLGIGGVA